MNTIINTTDNKAVRFNAKSPSIFSIPVNVYSDEIGKERDKEAYLKIKQLEKKCEQLRQKLRSYIGLNGARIETTRDLTLQAIAFYKKMCRKKAGW